MFRKQALLEIEFNEIDYQEALEWAKETVSHIRVEEKYEPSFDDFYCDNLCDFRNGACRFRCK